MKRNALIALLFLGVVTTAYGQYKMSSKAYCDTYKDIAIDKMQDYGIPASITLAQGILESGNGGSRLAVEGNNHFGIKCGSGWNGARITHNDDAQGECFRKYSTVEESYDDHSKFLSSSERYSSLFKLSSSDYTGWANGLQRAGYATNPEYAELLIGIIEREELHKYDTKGGGSSNVGDNSGQEPVQYNAGRVATTVNGVKCIIVRKGDTWEMLCDDYKMTLSRILRLNDLPAKIPLKAGDVIFLQGKKGSNKTAGLHTVQPNESRHSLSQKFGIRLTALQRLNPVLKKREAKMGDLLRFW